MKKSRFTSFFSLSLLLGGSMSLCGCDTIRARSRAQDGVQLYKDGKPQEAVDKFEQAQALDPTLPTIWLDLGFAELAVAQGAPHTPAGDKAASRAIEAFEKYLSMRPGEERTTSYLVQTFVDTSHYDEAVKWFKPQVEKTPPDTQALATLGTIASKVGKFDDAMKWYQQRIDADPTNSDARLNIGIQLWDRLRNHTEIFGKERVDMANRALSELKKARELSPESPNPYLYTNLVYRERSTTTLGPDVQNMDIVLANDFFQMANSVGKDASPEQKKNFAKAKADADVNIPKTDAAIAAAIAAAPPAGTPCAPAGPCLAAPPAPGSPEALAAAAAASGTAPASAPTKAAPKGKKAPKKGKK